MLTADLVNARRRGTELRLVALDDAARARAAEIATDLIVAIESSVGLPREELDEALAAIEVPARDHRIKEGLAKLLDDRCDFGAESELDPIEIRREVFLRGTAARRALTPGVHFDRLRVLAEVAAERGVTAEVIEQTLYSDLRGAHVLRSFESISPASLVAAYERGQAQAVLLRATKVTLEVKKTSAGATRALFRRLKFLQLLHAIEPIDDGYRVIIDGPLSLFDSVTKYGLKLALIVPALDACGDWSLVADVRWGKERIPLSFRLRGAATARDEDVPLPDEVATLLAAFEALDTKWRVKPSDALLELPGIGMCVPDLVFEKFDKSGKHRVHLEVMGYWSRAAVWRRVELVQAGLREKVLFAVSAHLRVSEEVLGDEAPSALYVYKRTMSARAIANKLDALVASITTSDRAR